MELRKYRGADVNRRRDIHFFIGLVISLILTYLLFTIKKDDDRSNYIFAPPGNIVSEEMPDIVRLIQVEPLAKLKPSQNLKVIGDKDDTMETKVQETEENNTTGSTDSSAYSGSGPDTLAMLDQNPEFPGGTARMNTFIIKNMQYPLLARENHVGGKVIVAFTVTKEGRITNVHVVQGLGFGCDEEAIKVVRMMPRWRPGKRHDRPVDVVCRIPIVFQLRDN